MESAYHTKAEHSTPGPIPENIPHELRERPQWVCWRYARRGGKWTKEPVDPNRTGRLAKTDVPATWSSFERAYERYRANPRLGGIGYVFSEDDPYFGVDFDGCIAGEPRRLDGFAAAWIGQMDAYVERSISGDGIHAIGRGRLPKGSKHVKGRPGGGTEKVELYDRRRFFCFTGDVYGPEFTTIGDSQDALNDLLTSLFPPKPRRKPKARTPANIDDAELLERARNSSRGHEFMRLYDKGDISCHDNDHSSADFALINKLIFWAAGDRERVLRLFEQSALYRDEGKHAGYVELSVDNALESYDGDYYDEEKTRRAVERVLPGYIAVLLSPIWTERKAVSAFKAYGALLDKAAECGAKVDGGIRVGVDIRTLAEMCNVRFQTLSENALPYLIKARLVKWVRGKGARAGYFVLLDREVRERNTKYNSAWITSVPLSHLEDVRQIIRLCYGKPNKKHPKARLGALAAIILLPLVLSGCGLNLAQLSEMTGRRPQDIKRRCMGKLLEAGLVVEAGVSGDAYRLSAHFWERFAEELEASGITESERLRKFSHDNHREGWRREMAKRKRLKEQRAVGTTDELALVEEPKKPDPPPKQEPPASTGDDLEVLFGEPEELRPTRAPARGDQEAPMPEGPRVRLVMRRSDAPIPKECPHGAWGGCDVCRRNTLWMAEVGDA